MTLVRWDPFRDFLDIQNELGRAFQRTFGEGVKTGAWVPAVDVYEQDKEIKIKADLPEMRPEEVEVSYEDDHLIISGERKFTEEVKEDKYYRLERRYGTFKRRIPLPSEAIKADEISASFSDGVLEVSIPKAEETKPRQRKIEIGRKDKE
jgi:HSP20 family protein